MLTWTWASVNSQAPCQDRHHLSVAHAILNGQAGGSEASAGPRNHFVWVVRAHGKAQRYQASYRKAFNNSKSAQETDLMA